MFVNTSGYSSESELTQNLIFIVIQPNASWVDRILPGRGAKERLWALGVFLLEPFPHHNGVLDTTEGPN